MMMLDDVVHTLCTDMDRMREGMERSVRWLDRALVVHKESGREDRQNLYGIVQGGLNEQLREESIALTTARNLPGYAIGGLAGGESKADYCRITMFCTEKLPVNQPRYLMGVGYAIDLVLGVAMGVDQFDCVFPTRTARFGCALVPSGQIQVKKAKFKNDYTPLDSNCPCSVCEKYTRAALHSLAGRDDTIATLLSIHNVAFQLRLMKCMRRAIYCGNFDVFCKEFLVLQYGSVEESPSWAISTLQHVGFLV
ncbi:hypothetical protein GEMRC1_011675 [Eukaryota sp. GEM-RC1]